MSRTPDNDASPVADFEASLDQLEQLVEKMEQGDMSLEESLAAYERGVGLTAAAGTRWSRPSCACASPTPKSGTVGAFLAWPMASPTPAATAPIPPWPAGAARGRGAGIGAGFGGDRARLSAMRHAVLLGGKRMRLLLTYATGACGAAEDALDARRGGRADACLSAGATTCRRWT